MIPKILVALTTIIVPICTPAEGQTVRDVFRQVSKAGVTVYVAERAVVPGAPGEFMAVGGQGSGVLIAGQRQELTAAHVVQASDRVMVEFPDGQQIAARVVSSVPGSDLALLELERNPTGIPPSRSATRTRLM